MSRATANLLGGSRHSCRRLDREVPGGADGRAAGRSPLALGRVRRIIDYPIGLPSRPPPRQCRAVGAQSVQAVRRVARSTLAP